MTEYGYPLHPYFTEMPGIGSELTRALKKKYRRSTKSGGCRCQRSRTGKKQR